MQKIAWYSLRPSTRKKDLGALLLSKEKRDPLWSGSSLFSIIGAERHKSDDMSRNVMSCLYQTMDRVPSLNTFREEPAYHVVVKEPLRKRILLLLINFTLSVNEALLSLGGQAWLQTSMHQGYVQTKSELARRCIPGQVLREGSILREVGGYRTLLLHLSFNQDAGLQQRWLRFLTLGILLRVHMKSMGLCSSS